MSRLLLLTWYCLCAVPVTLADESASSTAPQNSWPDIRAANAIDEQVFARLREQGTVPSQLADDGVFLRRLTLLTIGQLPSSADIRAFAKDDAPDKRSRKIDEVLEHKLHAALLATRYSEITGNSIESLEDPPELKPKRSKMWHDWLRRRFEENVPYDRIVRNILTATSHAPGEIENWIDQEAELVYQARQGFDSSYAERPTLDLFWRRNNVEDKYPLEQLAERVASAFLGVRINCARCHDHPFERWTQSDYRQFVQIFASVRFDLSPELRAKVTDRIEARRQQATEGGTAGRPLPRLREVYLESVPVGVTGTATLPKPLGGPEFALAIDSPGQAPPDYRVELMDWLGNSRNPFFARNVVNRLWAHYFGRGLVEPLDAISSAETRPYARLLDLLAADFIEHDYDLRHTERLILNSTTWQLSSEPNATNRTDADGFSRAYVRMPAAHTVIDMWRRATGTVTDFGPNVPAGIYAVELAPDRLDGNRWDRVLALFGRYPRKQTCDCGTANTPSIRQTLALMSDENLLGDITSGDLPKLLAAGLGDAELLDELFLRTLARLPSDEERNAVTETVNASDDRGRTFEDILWGLVNTQEFITIH